MTDQVMREIDRLGGIESSAVAKDGAINVIIAGGRNRALREEVIQLGMRRAVPVRVFYRMPDGQVIGEALEDYYSTVRIPGWGLEAPEYPADELAPLSKESNQLLRIRGKGRGRPVVAWKVGEYKVRKGTTLIVKAPTSLQWTMGRSLSVKAGVRAEVVDLSSRRPIAYVNIGQYNGVEVPLHALGSMFDLVLDPQKKPKDPANQPRNESKELPRSKEPPRSKESNGHQGDGKEWMPPWLKSMIDVVGHGNPAPYSSTGWTGSHMETDVNQPVSRHAQHQFAQGHEEDQLLPDPDAAPRPGKKSKKKDVKPRILVAKK